MQLEIIGSEFFQVCPMYLKKKKKKNANGSFFPEQFA